MACDRVARVRHLARRLLERLFDMGRLIIAGAGILVLLAAQACKETTKPTAPITITLIDQNWPDEESRHLRNQEFRRFTDETGIRVEVLPSPESAVDQLDVWRKLLDSHATVPDVYAMDVIWPAILGDQLLDLKPYVPAQEISEQLPGLIANFTVNGRLVALPYNLNIGVLFCRIDLLRKYGYRDPPKTWEELERAAARIQVGERARGQKNFWGFVWQGAPSEALTSNALEWQVSDGGGNIIENGVVTVNNPQTVQAWKRAARWPGSISPPSVVAYQEWDAFNRWKQGQAAFMRNWSSIYILAAGKGSPVRGKFVISPLPKGHAGNSGTLGGNGYAVSLYSLHPGEAARLVRFLCGRDEQFRRSQDPAEPATITGLYSNPSVLAANPYFPTVLEVYRQGIALRPSTETGVLYPEVSHAYVEAVHAVLTHRKTAETAAADLQNNLTQMTGLKEESHPGNGRLPHDTADLGR
jgi:trehalose/maltose transport system substrate-binding protein